MDIIKTIATKLGAGILYGAGFYIGLAILAGITMSYFQSKIGEEAYKSMLSEFVDFDVNSEFAAEVKSENIGFDESVLIGKLSNKGERSFSSVRLRAELYDESGSFIEECNEYIHQESKPGSVINVKLSCDNQ